SSPSTSVFALAPRSFSAKVFGGGIAGVFAAFFVFGAARFLAAFFGLLFGAGIFFVGFVGAFLLLFFGFLDAAVRELSFFVFFFILVAMITVSAPSSVPRPTAGRTAACVPGVACSRPGESRACAP